jgi:D-alanyl-D-alanine carboxypeptidase
MVFYNPSGLDMNTSRSGAYGSAKDMASLVKYILNTYPDILEITKYSTYRFTSTSGIVHNVSNTDTIVAKIPGLFASKTGYTDLAGGNLTIAYDEDISHPIIMVLLGSTEDGRFTDMSLLASSTRAYLSQNHDN